MRRRRLLLLAAGVAVVVLVCVRPFGGGGEPGAGHSGAPPPAPVLAPPPAPPPAGPTPGPTPGAGDDAHEDDVDGIVTGEEGLDPALAPDAVRAAERFAAVWSTPDPEWPDGLAGLATPGLLAELSVAAAPDRVTVSGGGAVLLDAPEWAQVGVPTDRGTILLDVTMVDGDWLVSALAFSAEEP